MKAILSSLALLLTGVMLSACQSQQVIEAKRAPQRADFTGAWEMDYSLNDSLEARLDQYFYGLRRELQRRSSQPSQERRQGQGYGDVPNANDIIAMARFADQITRTSTLDVEQTYNNVKIERDDSFALSCEFGRNDFEPYENLFGKEFCGWDAHQLIFYLNLPGGLAIQHRLTMGPDRQKLNVATTIYSDRVSRPFTLNRVYMRFDRLPTDFTCQQTVTKGKVCSLAPINPEEES